MLLPHRPATAVRCKTCLIAASNAIIAGYMSDAPAMQLQQLFEALDVEQPEDPVAYQALFLEDHDLNQVCIQC